MTVFSSLADYILHIHSARDLYGRKLSVLDATGKAIMSGVLRNGSIDIRGLSSGLYFLPVQEGRLTRITRSVKQ